MKLRLTIAASAIVAASALAPLPAGASVDQSDPVADTRAIRVDVPMEAVGFDHAVAEENGFEIVMRPEGTEISVPVTAEAKERYLDESSSMAPLDSKTGNCGTSHLYVGTPSSRSIQIDTGFSVNRWVIKRTWTVSGAVSSGGIYETFNGGISGATWSASRRVSVGNSNSGFASATGKVTLWTGTVCVAAIPSDEW